MTSWHFRVQAIVVIVAFSATNTFAAGFQPGRLLAADHGSVYQVDLSSGAAESLWTTTDRLHDIVFNPVSRSAFLLVGDLLGADRIVELSFDSGVGYQTSTFLDGLNQANSLAVNRAGTLFFDQVDFIDSAFWQASLAGVVTPVSQPHFFAPQNAAFSPDESQLYVSTSPTTEVGVVQFPAGTARTFSRQDVNFSAGIDVAADGAIYVAEGGPISFYGIRRLDNQGNVTTYAEQPWMQFLDSGFWGDLEYDDRDQAIYVGKGDTLYKLDGSLQQTAMLTGTGKFDGLDLIEPLPPPATPGDTDGDGVVDLNDLNAVRNNFGAVGAADGSLPGDAVLGGDTPYDGVVDLNDLNAVRNNFGAGAPAAVPEPATFVLLSLGALVLMGRGGRNWRRHGQFMD